MAHQVNDDNRQSKPVTPPGGDSPDPDATPDDETSGADKVRRGMKSTREPIPGGTKFEQ
jgi:hypothetical protein